MSADCGQNGGYWDAYARYAGEYNGIKIAATSGRSQDKQLRNKTPKRRVKAALRADRIPPSRSNEVWAMDFVHDQLATGAKLRRF